MVNQMIHDMVIMMALMRMNDQYGSWYDTSDGAGGIIYVLRIRTLLFVSLSFDSPSSPPGLPPGLPPAGLPLGLLLGHLLLGHLLDLPPALGLPFGLPLLPLALPLDLSMALSLAFPLLASFVTFLFHTY